MDPTNDDDLRAAVSRFDAELAREPSEDPLMTEVILRSFRGRRRWLTIFPILLSLVYTGLLVWCAYEFFQQESTKYQIAWAVGFLACAQAIGLVKVWVWGEWRRQSTLREIKRLELRVGELCDRLAAGS